MLRILVLCTLCAILHVNARPLIFAPLPLHDSQKAFEIFSPMIQHLENALGETITFRYEKKHDDIIALFAANQIDIAYFGPLPFSVLAKQSPFAQPLITFHEQDGSSGYRCVLVQFATSQLNTKEPSGLKVALTQPLSTCGYTKTKVLLEETFGLSLDALHYRYVNQHDAVALNVVRGEFDLGGMKESIAKEHASLGLNIIATSPLLPGFTLVVNTRTLTSMQIETIKRTLLSTPKEVYSTWGKEISYGMSAAHHELFNMREPLITTFDIPMQGNY